MRDGLAGGSVALAVCLRLHAEVLHERSVQQWRQWRALLASVQGEHSLILRCLTAAANTRQLLVAAAALP